MVTFIKQLFFPIVIFAAIFVAIQGELNWLHTCIQLLSIFMYFGYKGQTPRQGTVRLVRNGLYSPPYTSGRVQIYLTSWGHICDDFAFGLTEANVICHQLGYTGAASYSRASFDSYVLAVYMHCSSIILLTTFYCCKILYSYKVYKLTSTSIN